jgi:hypothetical protein
MDSSGLPLWEDTAYFHPPLETCLASFALWNANHVEDLLVDGMMHIPGSMRWRSGRFPGEIWVDCMLSVVCHGHSMPVGAFLSARATDHARLTH